MNRYIILLTALLLFSCKSYQIEPSGLKSQLEQTEAILIDGLEQSSINSYSGENLSTLKVKDFKNNEVILDTKNPIVLKVIRKDGFRIKYYLSSVSVNGSTFNGMGPTYLVGGMIHKIHIDSIASIKIKP